LNFHKLPLVYAEMNPGDALFFHSNTLHRSDQNRSENPRWTLICCYNTKHNDKYAKGGDHPAYSRLERWPDERIGEMGKKQLEEMKEQTKA
jgi:ectoine hydroxylase-related dioxygenase (phytanoyl-CoA dioxygenase family)